MSKQPINFRGHIPALDGVRGIAIALVLLSHFMLREYFHNERAYFITQFGWIGVDLFFVLSGFLITGILLDSKRNTHYWANFYRRRVLRILPLYYFVVTVTWLTVLFIEKAPGRLQGYDSFKWFFTFTPNISMGLKNDFLYHSHIFNLNHLWSLAIEEQFYLFWPLIVRYVPMRSLAILCLVLIAMGTGLRHLTDHVVGTELSTSSYTLPFCRMDGLAAGSFLAIAFRLEWLKEVWYSRWIARVVFCWMGVLVLDNFIEGTQQSLYTDSALFFAALLFLALNPNERGITRRVCENAFLQHLGKYSYGLYVFHHMFEFAWKNGFGKQLLASNLPPILGQALYILLAFAGTYLLARISWIVIEQPFLRLKKRGHETPSAS
jgi:peptidoglycan/LPS O-acetylase OafA/YrhL